MHKRNINLFLIFLSLVFVLSSCQTTKPPEEKTEQQTEEQYQVELENLNPNQKVMDAVANEKNIDMSQFPKTALNIPYANTKNLRQTLDIIYPSNGTAPYKTIMVIHGGGWMMGNKQSETIAPIFQVVNQGYAIVSLNYRLSNEVTWPKPLHDAKTAIRFIRANADSFKLDAQTLVVWGVSSGGHIAEMLGATNNNQAYEDLTMGYDIYSSTVQGIISWYGVSDITGLTKTGIPYADKIMGYDVKKNKIQAKDSSPINLVTKDFPPILLVHGTKDQVVPYQQSVDMQKKVNQITRIKTDLITFKGAVHADDKIKSVENVMNNLNFVDHILYKSNNPNRNTNYIDIKLK